MSRRALSIGLLIILLALASLVGGYFYGFSGRKYSLPFIKPSFSPNGTLTYLIVGLDKGIEMGTKGGRGDTLMVGSLDLADRKAFLLSIPRDTRVYIPGMGEAKINAAMPYGGLELCKEVVENLLGIPIDYYVKVEIEGLKKIVDLVGGVDIYVEKDMRYKDDTQHLYINLKKGFQHLNGEQALGYVRFRHDALGDLARVRRQQKFLLALMEKFRSPMILPRLPWLIKEIYRNVETNFTIADMLYLSNLFKHDLPTVETETLPGEPVNIGGVSYYEVDREGLPFLVSRLLHPGDSGHGVSVEVLNGNGIPGAAARAAESLSSLGFNIVYIGNADNFSNPKTLVIDHSGMKTVGEIIRKTLKCGEIKEDVNGTTSKVDFTIILGKDFH